jgi:hypothetical protein
MSQLIASASTLTVVLIAAVGCSRVQTLDRSTLKTVALRELTADPTAYQADLEAYTRGESGLVLKIEEGDELPLELAVHHPLMSVDTGANTVRFQRDLYLYLSAQQLLISPDGERWAAIHDFETWKELFGGFDEGGRGSLSVGLGVTPEDGATMTVAIRDQ